MRLIDADALLEKIDTEREILVKDGRLGTEHILVHYVREFVENAPTMDIVRCCECKYLKQNRVTGSHWCDRRADKVIVIPDDYCSFGERDEK